MRPGARPPGLPTLSRVLVMLLAMSLAAVIVTPTSAGSVEQSPGQALPRPFEPIHHDYVSLPANVMPWSPTWAPDGHSILFHDYNGGREWIADADGGGVVCVTCAHEDRPDILGAFTYAFPDERRMLIANELGSNVTVLECEPSLLLCDRHRYLPVDLSADDAKTQGKPDFGRRTYHLAPDGAHLGYSVVRLDSLVMVVARLERTDSGYRTVQPKVINPPSARSLLDDDPAAWAAGSQLFELKSFADGGRSAIVVGEPNGMNADMLKVDLATGEYTRLTGNADWDEDGAPSPDGRHLVVGSWRGMHRLDPLGVFPYEPFFAYPGFAAIASYYVSSRAGFQCDIQPWLLGAEGDDEGALMGQPLAPYRGGEDIIGNNLAGYAFWSPDSTRVLIQERQLGGVPEGANAYVRQKGTAPNRLMIARLDRAPRDPMPVVSSEVGDWALSPQEYTGAFGMPGTHVVYGETGSVLISRNGNPAEIVGTAVYRGYSRDGETILDGTETLAGGVTRGAMTYSVDLKAHDAAGNEIGYMDAEYTVTHKTENPQPDEPATTISGHADAMFKGDRASGIEAAAPCPDRFPTPSTLQLDVSAGPVVKGEMVVTVTVTASVDRDTRPVRRARVEVLGQVAFTDDSGVATVRLPQREAGRSVPVTAIAGDTFDPGIRWITLPDRAAR